MELSPSPEFWPRAGHSWLESIHLAIVPGVSDPILSEVLLGLRTEFIRQGHLVLDEPQGAVDIIITTAAENQPLDWHDALFFTARRRYSLDRAPIVYTLVHLTPDRFQDLLEHFTRVSATPEADPRAYDFPGLAPRAYVTLHEQGRRAGPILTMARLLQSQTMSIRIILVVGADHPQDAYVFDLVGAYPRISFNGNVDPYQDLVLRMVTSACTQEVKSHEVVGEPVPLPTWQSLSTPQAMRRAGAEFGRRQFFTHMVKVSNLVNVPRLNDAIASQYSEGCFATWEPALPGLVTTITGSIRPIEKDDLSDDELAIIVGVRPDFLGARVRLVDRKRNDNPSSEAVELVGLDTRLPSIHLDPAWGVSAAVPVVRSKLHGHRGVRSFDPAQVEHVFLDPPFYDYPVSCSTSAQARAIISAFSRSKALTHPEDPRQLVFTILPGHGLLVVEKWIAGKVPFQTIWEAMDSGALQIDSHVPQGRLDYVPGSQGQMILKEL